MVLIAFVDPESQLGAALSARIEHDISLVPNREAARWRNAIGKGSAVTDLSVQAWLRESLLSGEAPVRILRRARYLGLCREDGGGGNELSDQRHGDA